MGDWRPFIYGGAASMIAEIGTFPIDTTKTRLQIQGQHVSSQIVQSKYRGMLHATYRIAAEEGPRALYSGLAPALLRQATYGTIKIGIYYNLKKVLLKGDARGETLLTNVVCGVIAGSASSAMANPTDLLKVRMQARHSPGAKTGMVSAFADIYRREGLRGLWRGVGPTAQRAAVVAGVELPVYDICKSKILHARPGSDGKLTHFVSSFVAGLAGAVTSTPIDVIKTRLMNQRRLKVTHVSAESTVASVPIYNGSMDCLLRTVKHEGFFALYKGFIPTWVRLGPWNIIFFMVYEEFKHIY